MKFSVRACKACYKKGLLPVAYEFLKCLRKKNHATSLKLKKFESSKRPSLLFFPITELWGNTSVNYYVCMYVAHLSVELTDGIWFNLHSVPLMNRVPIIPIWQVRKTEPREVEVAWFRSRSTGGWTANRVRAHLIFYPFLFLGYAIHYKAKLLIYLCSYISLRWGILHWNLGGYLLSLTQKVATDLANNKVNSK